jgi:hypothetical protein
LLAGEDKKEEQTKDNLAGLRGDAIILDTAGQARRNNWSKKMKT